MTLRGRRLAALAVALQLGLPATGSAADGAGTIAAGASPPAARRAPVALVLSGGGARGLAHIGVIRELERMNIPVDCIAGTSMGGIIGGTYASGMAIADIEAAARAIDWARAFQERPDRTVMRARRKKDENGHFARPEFGLRGGSVISPAGVIYGQNISGIFDRLGSRAAGIEDFDRLPIPFRAIATDIATGTPVILGSGQLPLAMRATMSVPAVMAPVEIDGRSLIDGGLVDNLPVGTARALCGDTLIAVNLGTPLLPRESIDSAVAVGLQMVNILTEQNVRASLAALRPGDVLVSPQLEDLDFGSFDHVDELIAAGERAVRRVAAALAPLAVPPQQFAAWKERRDRDAGADLPVAEVRIAAMRVVNPAVLRAELEAPGKPRRSGDLIEGARRIFEGGDFELVQIGFTNEDGRRVAHLDAREKSWGPDYLRFGMSMTAQSGESTSFNALVGYTRTWLNRYGARWQNILQVGEYSALQSEFLQPLAPASPFFVAPRLLATLEQEPIYLGDAQLARFTRSRAIVALEAGGEFGRSGATRIGWQYGNERYEADIGPFIGDSGWTPIRALTARVDYDAMNKAHFATEGRRVLLDVRHALESAGQGNGFRRRILSLRSADTWRRNTFNAELMAGEVDHVPDTSNILFDLIPLGGFQRLSAYPLNRFRVNHVFFGRLGYQRNIPPLLGLELGGIVTQSYFGGSIEAAKIRQDFDPETENGTYHSASLFVGADTVLGPAALGIGLGSDNQRAVWLSIGIPWSLD